MMQRCGDVLAANARFGVDFPLLAVISYSPDNGAGMVTHILSSCQVCDRGSFHKQHSRHQRCLTLGDEVTLEVAHKENFSQGNSHRPPRLFSPDLQPSAPHHRQKLPVCCLDVSALWLNSVNMTSWCSSLRSRRSRFHSSLSWWYGNPLSP